MTKCKHCGEEIDPYFRGREIVWKHKNRLRYCANKLTKAEKEQSKGLNAGEKE